MKALQLVTTVVIAAACATAHAQSNLGFLQDAPMQRMNREDTALLVKNLNEALDRNADGHTSGWSNPKTGASGTVTPLSTFSKSGMKCRETEFTNFAGGFRGGGKHTLCRVSGAWKIAS